MIRDCAAEEGHPCFVQSLPECGKRQVGVSRFFDIGTFPGDKARSPAEIRYSRAGDPGTPTMSDYISVLLTLVLGAVIVGVMCNLNRLLGPRVKTAVKGEIFECGNDPSGPGWGRFSIKFYMVAILFIVFDVEVVFMYPWAAIYRELGIFGFVEMTVFVAILAVGYVYAWRKGALEWR